MSDIFDEVGEDLRRDQLKRMWQRYGGLVIALAVLVVLATGAYKAYEYWAQSRAARAGDAYSELFAGAKAGDHAGLAERLAALESSVPPSYGLLARFRAASEHAAMGETDNALAAFGDLAANKAAPQEMRDLAAVRAAMIAVDREGEDAMKARLAAFNNDISPWRHAARELLALAAVRAGDWQEAGTLAGKLIDDPASPPDVRSRARMIEALAAAATGKSAESAS